MVICGASRPESRSVRDIVPVVAKYSSPPNRGHPICLSRAVFRSRPGPNFRLSVASICRRRSSSSCPGVSGYRFWLLMFTIAVVCGTAVAVC